MFIWKNRCFLDTLSKFYIYQGFGLVFYIWTIKHKANIIPLQCFCGVCLVLLRLVNRSFIVHVNSMLCICTQNVRCEFVCLMFTFHVHAWVVDSCVFSCPLQICKEDVLSPGGSLEVINWAATLEDAAPPPPAAAVAVGDIALPPAGGSTGSTQKGLDSHGRSSEPWHGLRTSAGGHRSRHVFLAHSCKGGWCDGFVSH